MRGNPRSTAFVALARGLCEAGRPGEAEEVCRQGLAEHPGLVTGQVALGRALVELGRLEEAHGVLAAAARANPEHAEVFRWLGDLALRRGEGDRARAILEYAEELAPFDAPIASLLARAGGLPTPRAARPRSDFEDTRVADRSVLLAPPAPPFEPAAPGPLETPPSASAPSALEGMSEPAVPDLPASAAPGLPRPEADGVGRSSSSTTERAPPTLGPAPWWHGPRGFVTAGAVTLVALVLLLLAVGPRRPVPLAPTQEIARALATGTLPGLLRARRLARQAAVGNTADHLVTQSLIEALLAAEYGIGAAEAEASVLAALRALGASGAADSRLAVARALLALAGGETGQAAEQIQLALAAAPLDAGALFASARLSAWRGDAEGARRQLDPVVVKHPDFVPAALDWAAGWIDQGDPGRAAATVRRILARHPTHLRARLLLAEAERALGDLRSAAPLEQACRPDLTVAPVLRAGCALAAASAARLTGGRSSALRLARAAASEKALGDPRLLGGIGALLELLGDTDRAAAMVERAGQLGAANSVPVRWAALAVRLGRSLPVDVPLPLVEASGPERRLIAARAAFAQGGGALQGRVLGAWRPALITFDADLRALAQLSHGASVSPRERASLERRAERGHPVAAYVLGRLAQEAGDDRAAVPRLEQALAGHGDACTAAGLYVTAARGQNGSPPRHPGLTALRALNGQCAAAGL